MTTYDQNFNSTVKDLLLNLALEQKNLQLQKEASVFTHACAKENVVTLQRKLNVINSLLLFQQSAAEKLLNNQLISSSVLSTANEANAFAGKSVTNSSVAAANMQVAANAILRLASDVGSMFSIIHASGSDSEMYKLAETINTLMNDTAYKAETASQLAMEASSLSAEICSATVADKAKNTNEQAVALLNLLNGECNATKEQQKAISRELDQAITNEKPAQQEAEKADTVYLSAQEAYHFANKELNLNLQVHVPEKASDSYIISFDEYNNPFLSDHSNSKQDPAESYFIFLVKEQKKEEFSLQHAMACITRPGQFIQLKKRAGSTKTEFRKEIKADELLDSDGNAMKTEQAYAVIVMIQLKDEYKKTLSDFDDLLMAPSAVFALNIAITDTITDHSISEQERQLYLLQLNVLHAQHQVAKHQEGVTVLTKKSSLYQEYLAVTAESKDQVLNIKNLGDQLIQSALDLKENSGIALKEAIVANTKVNEAAHQTGIVINQLIYVAKSIHKLHGLLMRKKAVNPLISDELITLANTGCTDADHAVSLSLAALKSAFTAMAGHTETETIMNLEHAQSVSLYESLTTEKGNALSLQTTIDHNHEKRVTNYKSAKIKLDKLTEKLNASTTKLNTAQVALKSGESGLAAAMAAALSN